MKANCHYFSISFSNFFLNSKYKKLYIIIIDITKKKKEKKRSRKEEIKEETEICLSIK